MGIDFHQSVTAYPSEQQKKELASMIAKLPGAGACTVAKISTYFNERRKTVARASKPASELANAKPEVPTQALRIRIPPSRQRGPTSEPICPAAVKTDDLASRLRNALSQVSIPPTSPPKTFAELGRWCQETDASSEAFLRDISDRPGFTSASGCGATESARLR
ncbi:hypothetical protein OH76DRAFT_1402214 [Lentinus brumalis]|uniref:Uncharacterized protein n=1 Tax=Lentinus brumalis TaxID=2498619 RepID=A0A371DDI3_9APHY|nr:hypothetical protein OH76DRAFT_1402214 [Polyporus brumalis]